MVRILRAWSLGALLAEASQDESDERVDFVRVLLAVLRDGSVVQCRGTRGIEVAERETKLGDGRDEVRDRVGLGAVHEVSLRGPRAADTIHSSRSQDGVKRNFLGREITRDGLLCWELLGPAGMTGLVRGLLAEPLTFRCMGTLTGEQIGDALRDLLLSGGARAGQRRTPTAIDLDQALVEHVVDRLEDVAPKRDREADRSVAWSLLIRAVTSGSGEADHEARLLTAATHLLEVGMDPRDEGKPAPYADTRELMRSIGVDSGTLKDRGGVESRSVKYGASVSFRRYYAAVASGLGQNRDTLSPAKHIESDNLGAAVGRAYERGLRSDDALLALVEHHATPVPENGEPFTATPRRVKPLVWLGAAVAATTIVTAGILVANGIGGAAQGEAEAAAPLVTVESVASDPPKWTMNTAFWVPTSAPLEELEAMPDGCDDPDARAWLQKYGVYRDELLFKVRNVSGEALGLSTVASRGTSSPAQPGLIVKCSGGGEGGELDWSVLGLELGEDAVATLYETEQASNYFWRDLASGETVGILVHPSGEEDFHGTLTMDISPTSGKVSQRTVPAIGEAEAREIEWHAMPSDKSVVLTLPSAGGAVSCKVNGAELATCSATTLREVLDELWGTQ